MKTWKCVHSSASGLPDALRKYFHQPNSRRIPVASQAIHAIDLFVPLSTPCFIWVFGFCGIVQRFSPKLILVCLPILFSDVDPCDEDGDEADESAVEE